MIFPSVRAWRHRDGGFVLQVYGNMWNLEVCCALRRRDRYGVREPFKVSLSLYENSTLETK